ncbi:hypothetical protein C8E03_101761 [Lachnotalea glycerini]|uniref:DUF554 domain-containing protein n=1 Tax=Lachnotalea glycerini TaxID=1763509 RepID=A0A318EXY7_9FIRM|nr:DUF554 domain-containing protein [Lachnotalea glycerini]PXV96127.1 hypothetical protein C8E03_101761 [Lachnotalea glycerini]
MTGLGTLINIAAILIGTTIGMIIKGGLQKRYEKIVMQSIGLCVIFIGVNGVITQMLVMENGIFQTRYTLLVIISLVMGSLIGEKINIEARLENFGECCKRKFKMKGDKGNDFVEGFVSSSLLFCVGAMAIVGSIEDGLKHEYATLIAKSFMDMVAGGVLAASLGIGVYFSVIAVGIYQGSITLLAGFVSPYLNNTIISQISCVGSVLIFALGINLILGKKIAIGNMLPAVFMPAIIYYMKFLLHALFHF